MWGKKRRNNQDDGEEGSKKSRRESNQDIPYIEADVTEGEIPLDELDTFVIPARDSTGATITIHLNITPYLQRQLQIAVASRRFPYLTVADLVRHATVRHLGWLMTIRNFIPRHISSDLQAVNESLTDQELGAQVEAAYHRMDAIITRHLSEGDNVEAVKLYLRVRHLVSSTSPSPWKTRFITGLDHRYRYLISEVPTNGR